MINREINIEDFDYDLPDEKIAKYPLEERSLSKLLVYKNKNITDSVFGDIASEIPANSQLIFNKTKVVQARLLFFKDINTRPIEIFCLEPITMDIQQAMASKGQMDYLCLVGRAKKWKDGSLKIWLGKH